MEDDIVVLREAIEAMRRESQRMGDSHRAIEAKLESLRALVEATLTDLDKAGGSLIGITAESRSASREVFERVQASADDVAIRAAGRLRALSDEADQTVWNLKAYLTDTRRRLEGVVGVRDNAF